MSEEGTREESYLPEQLSVHLDELLRLTADDQQLRHHANLRGRRGPRLVKQRAVLVDALGKVLQPRRARLPHTFTIMTMMSAQQTVGRC